MMTFKIAFAGTSFFSIPFFEELYQKDEFDLKFVLTKDIEATKKQDNLFHFLNTHEKYKDIAKYCPKNLGELDPSVFEGLDAVVVVAYGFKIPPEFLQKSVWVNVHGSYLPWHRGAAPIQYTVLNQGKGVGLTAILMNEKIDQGGIIAQTNEVKFSDDDTFTSLANKLLEIGPKWFAQNLKLYLENKIKPTMQDDSLSTKAPSIKEKDRAIDWSQSSDLVRARINALSSFPCCVIEFGKYKFKALAATIVDLDDIDTNKEPGSLLSKKQLIIKCGVGAVRVTKLIPDSGKPMSDEEYLRGRGDIAKCL